MACVFCGATCATRLCDDCLKCADYTLERGRSLTRIDDVFWVIQATPAAGARPPA